MNNESIEGQELCDAYERAAEAGQLPNVEEWISKSKLKPDTPHHRLALKELMFLRLFYQWKLHEEIGYFDAESERQFRLYTFEFRLAIGEAVVQHVIELYRCDADAILKSLFIDLLLANCSTIAGLDSSKVFGDRNGQLVSLENPFKSVLKPYLRSNQCGNPESLAFNCVNQSPAS